jgi:hypothetical protein
MANAGMWQMEAGDHASAEPLLREALQMRRKLLGNEHAEVAGSLILLASLLVETGRFEEARGAAAEARAICLQALGAAHWRTAAAASVEGAALLGLGQVGQGAELLVNGLAALRADDGALTFYVDNAARWLAEYNHKRSSAAEAPKRIVMSQRVIQR